MADLLLWTVAAVVSKLGLVLAFADDTAVIFRDYKELPQVPDILNKCGVFSNFKLNLANAVAVPLFLPGKLEQACAV
eukprot:7794978-Alexandrium_andersonii.AAC.1